MTGIDVTPAVRAAAEALLDVESLDCTHGKTLCEDCDADAAVTAALPHLAEQFARLVEAFADSDGTWIGPTDPDAIMRRTARLIREAATGVSS